MRTQALTASQKQLVEENIQLASYVARRFTNIMRYTGLDYDDLVSLAYMGLCRGARLYDPERSNPSTYLVRCCETTILQELRKWRTRRGSTQVISLESTAWFLDNPAATLGDVVADKDTDVESEAIAHVALRRVMEESTERELTILKLYNLGMSQSAISPIIGVSQSHVSRIIRGIRRRADEALAESDGRTRNEENSAIDQRAAAIG